MDVVLAALGTLLAVVVGARLTNGADASAWLREKRLAAYLELIDTLRLIVQTFAVGLRVSTLKTADAIDAGHDFEGVEIAWRKNLDDLERMESRIAIFGGRLGDVYKETASDLMLNMLDALNNENVTEKQWDDLMFRGSDLVTELETVARDDLAVDRRHYAMANFLIKFAGRNVRPRR